jgi:hypothetical protein
MASDVKALAEHAKELRQATNQQAAAVGALTPALQEAETS